MTYFLGTCEEPENLKDIPRLEYLRKLKIFLRKCSRKTLMDYNNHKICTKWV